MTLPENVHDNNDRHAGPACPSWCTGEHDRRQANWGCVLHVSDSDLAYLHRADEIDLTHHGIAHAMGATGITVPEQADMRAPQAAALLRDLANALDEYTNGSIGRQEIPAGECPGWCDGTHDRDPETDAVTHSTMVSSRVFLSTGTGGVELEILGPDMADDDKQPPIPCPPGHLLPLIWELSQAAVMLLDKSDRAA